MKTCELPWSKEKVSYRDYNNLKDEYWKKATYVLLVRQAEVLKNGVVNSNLSWISIQNYIWSWWIVGRTDRQG